ncbi:branched chain amino acid ABC transporter substrate-binding protein [Pandoraea eparura]|jgi:branched-chain amino acid transport system substrate-binding protein|uniref:Branched chain amino acid ABC transporter substrate-binding protein n=1 Tax=Pandoraea eparura TaxID=2508291 RepID=A0A5E4W7Z1_9BURK|nr:branched-chain amino acid ABC transporter substrate-binding protein [Pandoraea eparura]VVE19380.1 branched chain amino acid ABC transporter substrate-binding protein [Pandoraea eparura]
MQSKLTLSAVAVAGLLAFGTANAQQAQEVKLGFAAPLTGAQAHYGKDMQNGIQLAIDEYNATKPVIAGKPVKFVLQSEDDQADPRQGSLVAQKLVDSGIKGMLGHFNSGTTIPASRIYAQAGIPEIAMATAPEYTKQGFKTTFRMMTSDIQQGSVVGTFAVKKLGFKNIAIVDDRTAYGQGLADEFEKAAKAAGGKIVRREFANDKAVDFRAILTNLKRANPDMIFYGGADAQAGPLAKQLRELGMKSTVMAGEMVKSDAFLKIAGDAANGAVVSLAGLPLDKMPGGAAYESRYKAKFGSAPETYSPYAYDGAMAMMSAMKKANSTDPAKYLPTLAKTSMPGVTTRELAYDKVGDLKYGSITLYKVVDGKWTVLETVGGK